MGLCRETCRVQIGYTLHEDLRLGTSFELILDRENDSSDVVNFDGPRLDRSMQCLSDSYQLAARWKEERKERTA